MLTSVVSNTGRQVVDGKKNVKHDKQHDADYQCKPADTPSSHKSSRRSPAA